MREKERAFIAIQMVIITVGSGFAISSMDMVFISLAMAKGMKDSYMREKNMEKASITM